jgi:hypothetical protein
MSKAAGLVLILAGLGVGAFAIGQLGDAHVQAAQGPASDALSRGAILKPELVPAPGREGHALPVAASVVPRMGEPRSAPERFAIPKDRDALARELQKELRRVGCYEGEISGTWSQSTRRAMAKFIERMNARLPVDKPDAVLYAMVKGQHEAVCGTPCAAGEARGADGRCVSTFLLAQAKSKSAPVFVATAATEKPAAAILGGSPRTTPQPADPLMANVAAQSGAPRFEGRMGLAGPPIGPTQGTAVRAPRVRAAATSAAHSRVGQGAQHWSSAIFGPRISNN